MAHIIRRREPGTQMSTQGGWDPLRLVRDMLGFDPFAGMESGIPGIPAMTAGYVPQLEVKETKDAYIFRADLPGVREDDLEISVTGNRLSMSGKREEEKEEEGERYYAYERSFGSFNRSFTLPEGADVDKVGGELKNGVLTITVPKVASVQPKKVPLMGGNKTAEPEKTPVMAEAEKKPMAEAEKKPKAA